MAKPIFVIVADGGAMRAYREDETARGTSSLHLVETKEFMEAHTRYAERFSDQAGAFPASRGGVATGMAERPGIQNETVARVVRQIADEIHRLVAAHRPEHWCLAAPPEINHAITERLHAGDRKMLFRNLALDLVKLSPVEILDRFHKAS